MKASAVALVLCALAACAAPPNTPPSLLNNEGLEEALTLALEAELLWQTQEREGALRRLLEAIAITPEAPELHARAARWYAEAGDRVAARRHMRDAFALAPTGDHARRLAALLDAEHHAEALRALERTLPPSGPERDLHLGVWTQRLLDHDNLAQADDLLELWSASTSTPLPALHHRLRATHAERSGARDVAVDAWIRASATPEGELEDVAAALRLAREGTPESHARVLEHCRERHPRAFRCWVWVAQYQGQSHVPQDTLDATLQRMAAISVAQAQEFPSQLALVRDALGPAGVAAWLGAIAERPGVALGTLEALAYAAYHEGEVALAVSIMREVIARHPRHAQALNFVGYLLADAGQHLDEAERLLEEAHALEPADANILDSLGWLYHQQGRYALARTTLERALALMNDHAVLWDHYARTLLALGESAAARAAWERALASPRGLDTALRQRIEAALEQLPLHGPEAAAGAGADPRVAGITTRRPR